MKAIKVPHGTIEFAGRAGNVCLVIVRGTKEKTLKNREEIKKRGIVDPFDRELAESGECFYTYLWDVRVPKNDLYASLYIDNFFSVPAKLADSLRYSFYNCIETGQYEVGYEALYLTEKADIAAFINEEGEDCHIDEKVVAEMIERVETVGTEKRIITGRSNWTHVKEQY